MSACLRTACPRLDLQRMASGWNKNNPGVKRIMQEMKELKSDPSSDFIAEALETDIFEWHFVMRGPADSEFEGGIYHGRILLPAEYPFKPPGFMMLSPNGRFETGVKICLSISSHHPEHWQPSWSVRTALTAMIAFMPSPGQGALGSMDLSKDDRKKLALKSRSTMPQFGTQERQRVINEMHARMLELEVGLQAQTEPATDHSPAPTPAPDASTPVPVPLAAQSSPSILASLASARVPSNPDLLSEIPSASDSAASSTSIPTSGTSIPQAPQPSTSHAHQPCSTPHCLHGDHAQPAAQPQLQHGQFTGDHGLNLLAAVLAVGILAILFRKILAANGWIDGWVLGMFS